MGQDHILIILKHLLKHIITKKFHKIRNPPIFSVEKMGGFLILCTEVNLKKILKNIESIPPTKAIPQFVKYQTIVKFDFSFGD
jgi:hypothetical protein